MTTAKTLLQHSLNVRYVLSACALKSFEPLPTDLGQGCSPDAYCTGEETDAQATASKGKARTGTQAAWLPVRALKPFHATFLSTSMCKYHGNMAPVVLG